MTTHRKPRTRAIARLHLVARLGPCFSTPAGVAVMGISLGLRHSNVAFAFGAVSSVTGWIALTLQGRTR